LWHGGATRFGTVHFDGLFAEDESMGTDTAVPIAGRRESRTAALVGLVVFGVLVLGVERLYRLERIEAGEAARTSVLLKAAATRARLERELNATLYLTSGLVGYVTAYDDLLEADRVTTALAALYRHGEHLRNVAMAPGNVLRYVYPLEGNRSAIGLDYAGNAEQWPGVERAMRERRTVLTGPIDLVQGGRGLIARTPVFLADDRYWGVLSLVIDIDSLLTAAGLHDSSSGIDYAVAWRRSEAATANRIGGKAGVFKRDPVVLEISVPGGAWQLAAAPAAGWVAAPKELSLYRLAGYALALVVAGLAFAVMRERQVIERMALQDPLTGLPNRRQFGRWLQRLTGRGEDGRAPFALLYVDLDGFKEINDRGGHELGDRVLRELAGRMRASLSGDERIARLGGDEFAVLLPGVRTSDTAAERGRALRSAVRRPIEGVELPAPLDVSWGAAFYPEDGVDPEDLMRAADGKMYDAKRAASSG